MQARLIRNTESSEPLAPGPDRARDFAFTTADFARIRALIYARAGISLSDHKRDMAYSRLARRLRARGLVSFVAYLDVLERENDPVEWDAFTNALTTNLTSFFREAHHFPILARHVAAQRAPVSVWCCASSTGEEPYSIAMTLHEALGARAREARILGTDVDTQVLTRAESGTYAVDAVKAMGPERLRQFFLRGTGAHEGQVKVRPALRAMASFGRVNLMDPQWPLVTRHAPFDAIFCRNVMIYFDKPTQGRILERFAPLLKPGGILFAGHSENFTYVTRTFRLRGQTVYELTDTATAAATERACGGGER